MADNEIFQPYVGGAFGLAWAGREDLPAGHPEGGLTASVKGGLHLRFNRWDRERGGLLLDGKASVWKSQNFRMTALSPRIGFFYESRRTIVALRGGVSKAGGNWGGTGEIGVGYRINEHLTFELALNYLDLRSVHPPAQTVTEFECDVQGCSDRTYESDPKIELGVWGLDAGLTYYF